MYSLHSWEATPRSNTREKQLEGHGEAPTYSCRSSWTNIYHLQQQKEVLIYASLIIFTRNGWSYFLEEKSEALIVLKHFKISVEKEVREPKKCLKKDRGRKLTSI